MSHPRGFPAETREDVLRYVALATGDAMYDWDIAAGSVWRSDTYEELYRPSRTTGPAQDPSPWWAEQIHPDDQRRVVGSANHAFEQRQQRWSAEYRQRKPDGSYATVVHRAYVLYSQSGDPARMVGSLADVTADRRREEALRRSEERHVALVKTAGQPVWIHDPLTDSGHDEGLAWWQELTGQKPDETGGWGWIEAIHPDDRERVQAEWSRARETGSAYDIEYRIRTHTGEYRTFQVRGVPIRNVDGTIREWVGMFVDISEKRRADRAVKESEERLRQSQKMEAIGRLAGGVAHDFNNILTVIGGNTQIALRTHADDRDLVNLLSEVRAASIRAVSLIKQLLAFGRKAMVEPVVLDMADVVFEAEKMLRRLLDESIELVLSVDPRLWRVKADRAQMDQIVVNLAVNAQQAMLQGGTLTIEAQNVTIAPDAPEAAQGGISPGQYVCLSVIDTGHGMSETTRDKIFEPFFTTRERGAGTGLGLAVVYGIVQQCGGQITVESEIDRGAAFRILLPRCDEGSSLGEVPDLAISPASVTAAAPIGTETLLLVEDDGAVRSVMRSMLVQYGYQVIDAGDGHEALRICETLRRPIHMLVTDVVMPRMDGLQLAKALGPRHPEMLTLFLSGHADDVLDAHGVLPDTISILHKPFEAIDLARKVRELLDQKAS